MESTDNGEKNNGNEDVANGGKIKSHIPLHISPSRRGLTNDSNTENQAKGNISAPNKRMEFLKFGKLDSPSVKFYRIAQERDDFSRTVPSRSHALRERVTRVFSRRMDWGSLWNMTKEWIRNPMNMVLFVWILVVAISGAILFMVMTGMLNHVLPRKSQRNAWFEVNNQILNALFTLMCLYQHPQRLYHLVLLCKWRPEDIVRLRKVYCKNGTYKPHEWAHMMVVVLLLNLNCFAQYALCGLNVGYKRSERPAIGVALTISVAIGAPAIAGVYKNISPLGKDYDSESDDEEAQLNNTNAEIGRLGQSRVRSLQKRFSFAIRDDRRMAESSPQWSGGVLDFWDDISLAFLSLFCSFCVFGWNMERLGFGNMYVHIATFLLFCLAPFWIFNLAAINVNDDNVRVILGVTGIFLCIFGLLYGGFWRIQMRKRFNLPPYKFCCVKPAITDCALWLFCCWCSLAQEVRTGNSYDIVEDKFFKKPLEGSEPLPVSDMLPISPLPREGGEFEFRSGSAPSSPLRSSSPSYMKSKSPSPSRFAAEYNSPGRQLPAVKEESSSRGKDETMDPPSPAFIQREDS